MQARVVKVNANILDKNWVTLQDGTGAPPEDKLTATTSQVVSVGDEFTVTGIVQNDVSLGSGYDYKVILEEAHFD